MLTFRHTIGSTGLHDVAHCSIRTQLSCSANLLLQARPIARDIDGEVCQQIHFSREATLSSIHEYGEYQILIATISIFPGRWHARWRACHSNPNITGFGGASSRRNFGSEEEAIADAVVQAEEEIDSRARGLLTNEELFTLKRLACSSAPYQPEQIQTQALAELGFVAADLHGSVRIAEQGLAYLRALDAGMG